MMLALIVVFLGLQALDGWTTYRALRAGLGHEGNPALAWVFRELGLLGGILATKIPVGILVALGAYALRDMNLARYVLSIVCIFYSLVVWENLSIIGL